MYVKLLKETGNKTDINTDSLVRIFFFLEKLYLLALSRNSPLFVETEGSLQSSQNFATGSYPESTD